jgi:3D (Asp-Asp-Asp) domain-containing protein
MKLTINKTLAALALGFAVTSLSSPVLAASYQVQPGDSLWKIARAHQISLASLQAANPNLDPYNLQIGQAVQLPGAGKYKVTDGETFWTISRKLNIPLADLLAANPHIDPQNLYPGIVLKLPVANPAPVAADYTAAPQSTVTTASGQSVSYSRVISAKATAYTASPQSNGSWGAVDYYGNPLKLGTIAVDPSVIPLGSKLYVTGYTFSGLPAGGMTGQATDIGGAIKGNRIDIFVPTTDAKASLFGIQNVKIYILK